MLETLYILLFQARLGWTGRDNKNIYCITHVDSFHMWETDEVSDSSISTLI